MERKLMIGWTTLADEATARGLAQKLVERGSVACAQVDGPITSFYRWQGQLESTTEYRVMVKFPAHQEMTLTKWLLANHPYDTPQWFVVAASHVSPAYLDWVMEAKPAD